MGALRGVHDMRRKPGMDPASMRKKARTLVFEEQPPGTEPVLPEHKPIGFAQFPGPGSNILDGGF